MVGLDANVCVLRGNPLIMGSSYETTLLLVRIELHMYNPTQNGDCPIPLHPSFPSFRGALKLHHFRGFILPKCVGLLRHGVFS